MSNPMPPFEETWLLEDLKKLQVSWPKPDGTRSLVSEVLPAFQHHILDNFKKYDYLIVSMREHGQQAPIRVMLNRMVLRDGIHRIAIADSMGWESMLVTITGESTWKDWDYSPDGQEYWKGVLHNELVT